MLTVPAVRGALRNFQAMRTCSIAVTTRRLDAVKPSIPPNGPSETRVWVQELTSEDSNRLSPSGLVSSPWLYIQSRALQGWPCTSPPSSLADVLLA
jgi:hypothetical protein